MSSTRWARGPVVAWTESDGPGELPPVPSRRVAVAAVLAAGVAGWGLLTADEVCPEHSLLIELVASFAIVLTVLAVIAALRSSVLAAPLVLAASACGLVIGIVDALHDVTRSRVIVIAFAVAAVASGYSALQSMGLGLWERRVLGDAEAPLDLDAALPPPTAPAPVEAPSRDDTSSSVDRR